MAVRITNGTTNRTYLKNLNGSQKAMNKAMERVESGRDFQRVSENVTQATRAINVRSRIYRNEQMTANVNTMAEQLTMAESALKQMNDICSSVQSEMFKALNTPTLQAGKETFSAFLDGAKDEFMRLANTKYNDKYVLGGLGIDVEPFKANADGEMEFNGAKLSEVKDRNQIMQGISLYDDYLAPTSNNEKKYACIGGVPALHVTFDGLKKYLDENDESKIFSQYTQYAPGANLQDWKSATYWIPAECTHDHDGFLGIKSDGTTLADYSVYGNNTSVIEEVQSDYSPLTSSGIETNVENYYYDGAAVKYSGTGYIDDGGTIKVSANGKVEPKGAFQTTVDGIAAMGYGSTDVSYDNIKGIQASAGAQGSGSGNSEKVSNNIYDMMTQMQDAINSLDDKNSNIGEVIDKISAVMYNFQKQTDKVISAQAEIGVRSKFLDTKLDRLETENASLKKMQKDIEGVDDATEITNYMSYQNAWNMVLQFGKNIVPKSLMDYIN